MHVIRLHAFRASRQSPETKLREKFSDIVTGLNAKELLVPVPGARRVLPRETFGLIPILTAHADGRRVIEYSGRAVVVPRGVIMTYPNDADFIPGSKDNGYQSGAPYIDTGRAIGLTHASESGPHLIAVAAAGIEEDILIITQLQDVTGMTRETHGRAIFQNALRGGYYWRDTLVHAWEHVGVAIGIGTIAVRSHVNSRWPEVKASGYDAVAKRLGFIQETSTLDWRKPVR